MLQPAELLKSFFAPGSLWPLLVIATTAGIVGLAVSKKPRTLLIWLVTVCGAYWLGSVPAVAEGLATGFGRLQYRRVAPADLDGINAIVVLGAGAYPYSAGGQVITVPTRGTALNAFEGARVFAMMGGRVDVIASGGVVDRRDPQDTEAAVVRRLMTAAGVPENRVLLETESRTTHEQAKNVAAILRSRGWLRVALITSPVHLLRAVGGFRHEGIDARAAPASFASEHRDTGRSRWWPTREALDLSTSATYDYVALVYYEMRGWVRLRR